MVRTPFDQSTPVARVLRAPRPSPAPSPGLVIHEGVRREHRPAIFGLKASVWLERRPPANVNRSPPLGDRESAGARESAVFRAAVAAARQDRAVVGVDVGEGQGCVDAAAVARQRAGAREIRPPRASAMALASTVALAPPG